MADYRRILPFGTDMFLKLAARRKQGLSPCRHSRLVS
jgi:hypothetical protein